MKNHNPKLHWQNFLSSICLVHLNRKTPCLRLELICDKRNYIVLSLSASIWHKTAIYILSESTSPIIKVATNCGGRNWRLAFDKAAIKYRIQLKRYRNNLKLLSICGVDHKYRRRAVVFLYGIIWSIYLGLLRRQLRILPIDCVQFSFPIFRSRTRHFLCSKFIFISSCKRPTISINNAGKFCVRSDIPARRSISRRTKTIPINTISGKTP